MLTHHKQQKRFNSKLFQIDFIVAEHPGMISAEELGQLSCGRFVRPLGSGAQAIIFNLLNFLHSESPSQEI
jgi:hypothetical protein